MARVLPLAAALLTAAVRADSLWPQPTSLTFSGGCLLLDASALQFVSVGANSSVLDKAVERYTIILSSTIPSVSPAVCAPAPTAALTTLTINVQSASLDLSLTTSEAYTLTLPPSGTGASLTADTVYGAMRGLETLSQLVDWDAGASTWVVPSVAVADKPAFAHRGALVDTARHFVPLPALFQFVDALAFNKMNVLHWHIVDDQSFPWVSVSLPSLSALGAYGAPNPQLVSTHSYSTEDVASLIAYAASWGVRVLPEFDTPGHSQSWGLSQPGLLTQCYNVTTGLPIPGVFGPIDPTQNSTYAFLETLFTEVGATFPDQYVHVGGDEVSYTCWASNPAVNAWMAANGIAAGDYAGLEGYYVQKVLDLMTSLGKSYVGWQEIFDNGLRLAPDAVIGVWKYHNTGAEEGAASPSTYHNTGAQQAASPSTSAPLTWQGEVFNVTAAGFRAIISSPWYLNYISYGLDWPQYYTAGAWLSREGGGLRRQVMETPRPRERLTPPPLPAPPTPAQTSSPSTARPPSRRSSWAARWPCGESTWTTRTSSPARGRARARQGRRCGPAQGRAPTLRRQSPACSRTGAACSTGGSQQSPPTAPPSAPSSGACRTSRGGVRHPACHPAPREPWRERVRVSCGGPPPPLLTAPTRGRTSQRRASL